jgi:hypothetical protein
MKRIDLVQDRNQWKALVNTEMNLQVPRHADKFLSSCITGDFARVVHLNEVCYVTQNTL